MAGGLPGGPCGVQGVGLAGAGLADHHGDAVSVAAEPADHGGLLGGDRWAPFELPVHNVGRNLSDAAVAAGEGGVDDMAFEGEQLRGRVGRPVRHRPVRRVDRPDGAVGAVEGDHRADLVVEDRVGQLLDQADVGAGQEPLRPGLQDVPAVERGRVGGQPVRAGQLAGGDDDGVPVVQPGRLTVQQPGDLASVEAEPNGTGLPPGPQRALVELHLLRNTRVQRRDLRRLGGGLTALGEPGQDLTPALGEVLDHRTWDAGDVGGAVDHRGPGDAEPAGELITQMGLVEVAGGLGLPIQLPAIQRAPAPVVRRAGGVGDQHMGVQQRIGGPRRAVPECRPDKPLPSDLLGPAGPAAGPARRPLQVAERRLDGGVVGTAGLVGDLVVAEPVEQRHRLGGAEGQVEPGHRPLHLREQPRPVFRVLADEDGGELLAGHPPRQAERLDPGAEPDAGGLAAAEVVVLHPGRDGGQVVALRAGGELADVQHPRPARAVGSGRLWRPGRTPGASL